MDWTIGPLDPWTISWTIFWDLFFSFGPFYRGGDTICTQGGVGCSLSVLREE